MSRPAVLLVDDDEAVLDFMKAKLGMKYRLVTTSAAGSVLALAREHRPDVIVCDVDMPGMDGGDVSAALFADEKTRDIPVLFLSALLDGQKEVGGRHAIAKSAPVAELIARIEALLK